MGAAGFRGARRGRPAPRSPAPVAVAGGGRSGGAAGASSGAGAPSSPPKGLRWPGPGCGAPRPSEVPRCCPSLLQEDVPAGSRRWGSGQPALPGEGENEIREAQSSRGAAGPASRSGTPGARRRAAGRAPASLPPRDTSLRRPQPLRKPGEMISPISLRLLSFFFFFFSLSSF